jgi:phosphoribosylglycinamide formyltransferase-1
VHKKLRIGVLGSGKGSNFAAIAECAREQAYPAEIALVLSDVETSGILTKAQTAGVPCDYLPPGKFRSKLDDEAEALYIKRLREASVDLIALAGFMRILKAPFLGAFENRVINIHPSLLPAFPGLEAWKQALEYGVKFTGCTVHFVDQSVDTGPIIAQQAVPVLDNDTPETLHARIQEAERILYPATIASLADQKYVVQGRRCLYKEH